MLWWKIQLDARHKKFNYHHNRLAKNIVCVSVPLILAFLNKKFTIFYDLIPFLCILFMFDFHNRNDNATKKEEWHRAWWRKKWNHSIQCRIFKHIFFIFRSVFCVHIINTVILFIFFFGLFFISLKNDTKQRENVHINSIFMCLLLLLLHRKDNHRSINKYIGFCVIRFYYYYFLSSLKEKEYKN